MLQLDACSILGKDVSVDESHFALSLKRSFMADTQKEIDLTRQTNGLGDMQGEDGVIILKFL